VVCLPGSTFSNVPVTEVLRSLLYPYIAPSVTSLSFGSNNYVEAGNNNSYNLNYQIYKNSSFTVSVSFTNAFGGTFHQHSANNK
jgi:hypothetical protein